MEQNNLLGTILSKIFSHAPQKDTTPVNNLGIVETELADTVIEQTPAAVSNAVAVWQVLKKSLSDPLGFIIMLFSSVIMYIYFANDFFCKIVGLIYPAYYTNYLLHVKTEDRVRKIKSIMKYYIIYSHLEIISYIVYFMPMLYHLKIICLLLLIYTMEYRNDWLNNIYRQVIIYDQVMGNLFSAIVNRIQEESTKITLQQKN